MRGFVRTCEHVFIPETRIHTLFKRLAIKVIAFALIVGLNASALSTIGNTVSYYNDTEKSVGNIFTATSLDFSLTSEGESDEEFFRTQTQGGWGSKANGNNPGSYRDAHFDNAFPNGVVIGDPLGFSALFTTSEAVKDFLPQGGTPNPFTQNHSDPEDTEAGVLGGQVIALSLSIGFDVADPDFGDSPNPLSDFVVPTGNCAQMTAEEVLAEANKVLGGTSTSTTPSDINDCVDLINNTFVPGEVTTLTENNPLIKTFLLQKDGALNFKYNVFATSTEESACSTYSLEAKLDGNSVYNGPLNTFSSGPFIYEDPEDWQFIFNEENAVGTCEFEIEFLGWQENFSVFGGYSDSEKGSLSLGTETLPISPIVLNEILPNPTGNDSQDGLLGEWVEIYNNTSNPIDLAGWYTRDSTGRPVNKVLITASSTLGSTTVIPANGFLILFYNKAILNNDGDSARLFDSDDNLIDEHSFGATAENKSHARIPDGTGPWIDPIPTPGEPNTAEEIVAIGNAQEPQDTEAPVITINGNNPATIAVGETYNDLSALVTDNVNNNLGITTEGASIDTEVPGTHEVIYRAIDQAGNEAEAVRHVVIYDPALGEPDLNQFTKEEVLPTPDTLVSGGGGSAREEEPTETLPIEALIETEEETAPLDTATTTEEIIIESDTATITTSSDIASTTDEIVNEMEEETIPVETTPEEVPAKEEEVSALPQRDEEEVDSEDESAPGVTGDDDPPVGPRLIEDIISPNTFVAE